MLLRSQLRQNAVNALLAANTLAGPNVFSPRDWPTYAGNYPALLVQTTKERKESNGRTGLPTFTTTTTLAVTGRLEAATATDAEMQLETLAEQIQSTILTNYSLISSIQQFVSVDTRIEVTAEGKRHIGEVQVEFDLEYFEAFDPAAVQTVGVPLTSMGIHADLLNPYDPNGTYTPSADAPAYTPTPAPRTIGPDGRDEGALDINLPQ